MSALESLEVTLKSDSRFAEDGNAALVDLCRTLAEAIDAKGGEPTTHQLAAYLSALKDLRRIVEVQPKGATGASSQDGGKPSLDSIRGIVTEISSKKRSA